MSSGPLNFMSPYRPRFVGLSKSQPNVPQLLSSVRPVGKRNVAATPSNDTIPTKKTNAKPTEDSRPKLKERGDTNNIVNKPLAKLAMEDIDPEAPPQSGSESEESPCRGDIRKSEFKTATKSNPPLVASRARRQTTQRTVTSARAKSSQSSQPSSSASRRRSDEENDSEEISEPENKRKRKSQDRPELGTHLNEDPIFGNSNKPQRVKHKFGKGNRTKYSPKKGFQEPPEDVLAKKQSESPREKLHIPSKDSFPSRGSPHKKRIKSSLVREKLKVESPEEERPKFIIPALYSSNFDLKEEDEDKAEITGVSAIDRRSESPSPLPTSSKASCSMCGQEVDEEVRKRFDEKHPGSRFNLRREQKFCLFHKRSSARKTWKAKGYPNIDWNKLDKRIADRYRFLQAILEGGPSYYGDIFKKSVKSGQNRTLLKSETNITPGYYGIRGLRAMTDNLTYKFSGLLRERAVQDRLISARGHTAYLQTVLVPELAVQLIKEDMSVSKERARGIMEESTAVGELLHEEVKDVVLESEPEDEKDEEDHESTDDSSADNSDLPEFC